MRLKQETHLNLPLLMLVLIVFGVSSCKEVYLRNPFSTEPPIIIYPIEKLDIFSICAGSKVIDPNGIEIIAEKNGWFISDFYQEEILKCKVE